VLRREESPRERVRPGRKPPGEALGAQVAQDCDEEDRRLGRFVAGVERAAIPLRAFAEGIRLSWSSGLHLRRLLSYAALDLPVTLRNNVLPQFGQALRAEAADFSSWVASHLEHT
jgi:hypothetical protein